MSVAELAAYYKERELGENSGRAEKPRKAYLNIFKTTYCPNWKVFH